MKEAVEPRRGHPWGQVMHKARAEPGERGGAQESDSGPDANTQRDGRRKGPKDTAPQGADPAYL